VSKDANKPHGDVTYADPGYQKDGTKRYPIDTADHVRAAISYISQRSNSSRYDKSQLAAIKARIRRAATKFGVDVSEDF